MFGALNSAPGEYDYGGPAKPVNRLGDGDPVGADLPDNHQEGSSDAGSGNVLRKSVATTSCSSSVPKTGSSTH